MSLNREESISGSPDGTIILTGANGSLGVEFVRSLLQKHPSYCVILTVRDDSINDPNTAKLRKVVSSFPNATTSIETLDLASFSSVRSFSDSVKGRVSTGKIPPISLVVCNAFSWCLAGQKVSKDDLDLTFQVSHLSHFLLVMTLLGSMDTNDGRVVLLGSDAHDIANKSIVNPLGASMPKDLEELVKPAVDRVGEEWALGFQRYANSKLANVMFMHTLNRKLCQNPSLKNLTAIAMEPGGMPTSRAFHNTPLAFKVTMFIVGHFLLPVLRYFTAAIRTTQCAGLDLVQVSIDPEFRGQRGYFLRQKLVTSSLESRDEMKQEELWTACEKWVGLHASETALKIL